MNGCLIQAGDDVLIASDGDQGNYIAHVKELFESDDSRNANRAVVLWYYQYHELPKKCKTQVDRLVKPNVNELYMPVGSDGSGHRCWENIDAETIKSKCKISVCGASVPFPKNLDDNEFAIRYGFDERQDLLCAKTMAKCAEHVETPQRIRNKTTKDILKTPAGRLEIRINEMQAPGKWKAMEKYILLRFSCCCTASKTREATVHISYTEWYTWLCIRHCNNRSHVLSTIMHFVTLDFITIICSAPVLLHAKEAPYLEFYSFWKWFPWEAYQKLGAKAQQSLSVTHIFVFCLILIINFIGTHHQHCFLWKFLSIPFSEDTQVTEAMSSLCWWGTEWQMSCSNKEIDQKLYFNSEKKSQSKHPRWSFCYIEEKETFKGN